MIQKYPSLSLRAPSPVKYVPGICDQYWLHVAIRVAVNCSQHGGPGFANHKIPSGAVGHLFPSMVTISGTTPRKGRVAEPGLVPTPPGIGLIMMDPVSVCHQVSTMGQRSWPMASRYRFQASG